MTVVSATAAVLEVTPVPLALNAMVFVPATAAAPTAIVTTLDVAAVPIVAGLNVTVTPVGVPEAVNATSPVNPPLRAMVREIGVLLPDATLTAAALALSVMVGVDGVTGVDESPPQATNTSATDRARHRRIKIMVESR